MTRKCSSLYQDSMLLLYHWKSTRVLWPRHGFYVYKSLKWKNTSSFPYLYLQANQMTLLHTVCITHRNPLSVGNWKSSSSPTWIGKATRVTMACSCLAGKVRLKWLSTRCPPASSCWKVQKCSGWISWFFSIAFSMGWAISLKSIGLTFSHVSTIKCWVKTFPACSELTCVMKWITRGEDHPEYCCGLRYYFSN